MTLAVDIQVLAVRAGGTAHPDFSDADLSSLTLAFTGGNPVTDELIRLWGDTKDIIISGGINIYAAELERAIAELPDVLEVAVISVSDNEFGETPAALIRTAESSALTAAEVVQHCRESLSSYKAPRYVEFLAQPLPRTAGMKIRKGALRDEYADLPVRGERLSAAG